MKYKIKKETKPTLANYGKYKAVASHHQTVEYGQILKEVCVPNFVDELVANAVISKLSEVISRHLRNGDKVRLKGFGLMKLEIESEKVDAPEDFKPRKHIRGVRLHFIPESATGKPELYQGITFEKERQI